MTKVIWTLYVVINLFGVAISVELFAAEVAADNSRVNPVFVIETVQILCCTETHAFVGVKMQP